MDPENQKIEENMERSDDKGMLDKDEDRKDEGKGSS